jgi:hypothetical protein
MGKPSDTQSPVKSSEWLYQPPRADVHILFMPLPTLIIDP